jgi:hypothetical protein
MLCASPCIRHLIVRISSSAVPENKVASYLEYMQGTEVPHYEAAAGLTSFSLLQRPFVAYVEVMTISLWQSQQFLTRFLEDRSAEPPVPIDYGAIQFEARNYTVLISSRGAVEAAEEPPLER